LESYIIRIYRRDENNHLTGLIEVVENGTTAAFSDREELWRILAERRGDASSRPKTKARKRRTQPT
jgi:hypothetical protein